jgi:hypothetical protein
LDLGGLRVDVDCAVLGMLEGGGGRGKGGAYTHANAAVAFLDESFV